MAQVPVSTHPMFKYCVMLFLSLSGLFFAEENAPVAVTVQAKEQTWRALADVVLEIRISNPSGQLVRIQTIDADPPINLKASYVNGDLAISTTKLPKNRRNRNVDYVLEPNQTRSYEAPIRDLLGKGQQIVRTDPGEVDVSVLLPDVQYESGAYKVTLIPSNSVRVAIARVALQTRGRRERGKVVASSRVWIRSTVESTDRRRRGLFQTASRLNLVIIALPERMPA